MRDILYIIKEVYKINTGLNKHKFDMTKKNAEKEWVLWFNMADRRRKFSIVYLYTIEKVLNRHCKQYLTEKKYTYLNSQLRMLMFSRICHIFGQPLIYPFYSINIILVIPIFLFIILLHTP